jgi:hypothetical protein
MRQMAHICVALRNLLRPKRRRNRRFSPAFWPKIGGRIAKVAKKPAGAKAYAESTDAAKV